MAIHNEEIQEMEAGISKGIDASAMGLIMDNLQRDQYQFPIKSTVREIVCNGIDSVADKNAALDILNGAPVSKYFVEREGAVYKDSKFDPAYYDPYWLSTDDKVYITYQEGSNQQKDCIIIEDFGAGLGGSRLRGYMQLGYSTKRLSKLPLGKFGIGAKSALSVGVQFFTMETRYNGRLYRFNIYSSKVDSIVPQFNLDRGEENPHEIWLSVDGKPIKVYYENTDEKNGVTVIVEAKKHHKGQYIDAVKSQLLYFQNLSFSIVHKGTGREHINYTADILYEDDYIVLSDNSMWSKPHLLLNKVNYGYINFDELELEQKSGNIGIKVDPEEVEVNPSRESIIWSDKTKQMVLDRYKTVVGIATEFIQQELQETDFVKWLRICYQISSRRWGNGNSVVNRLAGIIDLSQVEPCFPGDKSIRFHPINLLNAFQVRHFNYSTGRKANRNTRKVHREVLKSGLSDTNWLPIVLMDENTSVRRDKYLLNKVYPDGFIGIKAPDWINEDFTGVVVTNELMKQLDLFSDGEETNRKNVKAVLSTASTIWQWLSNSSESVLYSSIVVPDEFKCSEDDEEEEVTSEEDVKESADAYATATERRKAEGKVVVHTPFFQIPAIYLAPQQKLYSMTKLEIPIKEINDWDMEEIFYGNDEDLELLHFATFITRENTSDIFMPRQGSIGYRSYEQNCTHFYNNPRLRIIKVAKPNNKLFSDFKHIQKFFVDVKNKHITMSNALIRWNTARQIATRINQMAFLWNFKAFDEERSNKFRNLLAYLKANYTDVASTAKDSPFGVNTASYNDLLTHLDNVQAFQLFVTAGHAPEDVAQLAQELFGNPGLEGGNAVDLPVWQEFNDLLEYCQVLAPLLNELPVLTGVQDSELLTQRFKSSLTRYEDKVCQEVETEIRQYMNMKGVL